MVQDVWRMLVNKVHGNCEGATNWEKNSPSCSVAVKLGRRSDRVWDSWAMNRRSLTLESSEPPPGCHSANHGIHGKKNHGNEHDTSLRMGLFR